MAKGKQLRCVVHSGRVRAKELLDARVCSEEKKDCRPFWQSVGVRGLHDV